MAVTGIGGLFFRARDPDALAAWYKTHFDVGFNGYDPWMQQAGPTVFQPFAADSSHIPEGKQWMLNLRIDDIDAQIKSLQAAGIEIVTDPAWNTPETGKFARVHDPEGNAVELWEPPVE